MPYSEKAMRFFRAREHGFVPDDPKLRKLSPEKAGELADEGAAADHVKRVARHLRKRLRRE